MNNKKSIIRHPINRKRQTKAASLPPSTSSIFTNMELNTADWKSNTPDQFAIEGYHKNLVAYRCIKEISDNIGGLIWEVYNKRTGRVLDRHPLLELLNRPSPFQSKTSFFTALESFKQISGDTYVQAVGPDNKPPKELYVLPPAKMKIIAGDTIQMPLRYEYRPNKNSTSVVKFEIDQLTGESEIMHIKFFNPLSQWYGQSPIAAASFSIDLHNESSEWNMRLLQNGARPSGALIAKGGLQTSQRQSVRDAFTEAFTGPRNAGKPLVMEGDLEWVDMMLSPKDMDYIESRNVSARDIATTFRVPPVLLNIGGDTTYSNMQEARLSMVENTIIPEADSIMDELNHWLVPMFGDNIALRYNKDEIPAIMTKRSEIYTTLSDVSFLTINEKRELAGFDEMEGGDQLDNSNVDTTTPVSEPETESKQIDITTKESETEISNKHFHKYNNTNNGTTTETEDHTHQYIIGDTKTSVVDGHSHKL